MNYYINIGSNLGNRLINLSRAVSAIEKEFGWFELSKHVESEPWGYESSCRFLNIGMLFISDRAPLDVLHTLQHIEKTLSADIAGKLNITSGIAHRNHDGTYADRILDIDIMAVDNIHMDTPELTLPHPHLSDRPFFLGPYRELLEINSQNISS